jgi:hypothetical protein
MFSMFSLGIDRIIAKTSIFYTILTLGIGICFNLSMADNLNFHPQGEGNGKQWLSCFTNSR